MSNKSTVPPYTKTDGTKVRGHEKRKPQSGPRRGVNPDAAVAAAAAHTEHDATPSDAVKVVSHTANGWHHSIVRTVNPRTHTEVAHSLSWRSQEFRCHGQTWMRVNQEPPVNDFDPHSNGGVTPWIAQCGTCGSLREARVNIRRL